MQTLSHHLTMMDRGNRQHTLMIIPMQMVSFSVRWILYLTP